MIRGEVRDYRSCHPGPADVALVVEVAETSLQYDRTVKKALYAAARILIYWIVNVVDNQVEVYRDPVPDPTALHGYRYRSRTDLRPPQTVSPLALPQAVIAVSDLLS